MIPTEDILAKIGKMKIHFIFFCLGFLIFVLPLVGNDSDSCIKPWITIRQQPAEPYRGFLVWENSPVFAVYANDTVVWKNTWETAFASLSETNIRSAEKIIRKIESIVATYDGKTFLLTSSSEREKTTIWAKGRTLTILGDWRKPRVFEAIIGQDLSEVARMNIREKKLWSSLPEEVRNVLDEIRSFNTENRRIWRPKRLLLQLQSPITVRSKAIEWPAEWPQSFSTASNNMKWIELPGTMLAALTERIPDDGESKIIMFEGEARYGVLWPLFPGDQVKDGWLKTEK